MPAFNNTIVETQCHLKRARTLNANKVSGEIGTNGRYSYVYSSGNYYVSEGVFDHLVTTAKMDFYTAKALFDALCWDLDMKCPEPKVITALIKKARKIRFRSKDQIFWLFVDGINSNNI